MRKITIIVVLSLTLLIPISAYSNDAEKIPTQFMENLLSKNIDNTVDEYFSSNSLVKSKVQQVEFVKAQIASGFKIFGKPFGYELAIKEDMAPSLKRFVFITKHDSHALVWEFYVYKPKDKWIASNMVFNDNFNLLTKKR